MPLTKSAIDSFLGLLLSSASIITKLSLATLTTPAVKPVGANFKVEENAPEVALAPPDKPSVALVVIVTPVISPSPTKATHAEPL